MLVLDLDNRNISGRHANRLFGWNTQVKTTVRGPVPTGLDRKEKRCSQTLRARLAIVGAGTIGTRHITAISKCAGAQLVGVAERDSQTRAGIGQSGIAAFPDTDSLLNETSPDGVIIATPTDVHVEAALQAIDAGIPVLIEKPVAASVSEGEEIALAAGRNGVEVLIGHHRRHHPQSKQARRMVLDGQLGDLVLVSGVWGVRKHAAYYEQGFRLTREAGPVMINVVHDIDLLRHVCGEIVSVSARLSNRLGGGPKEDAGVFALKFASGALGSFAMSDRVNSPWAWEYATGENRIVPLIGKNCYRFMGTEASLDFPNLVHWTHDCTQGDWTRPMSGTQIECERIDPFERQIEHFLDVISGDAEPICDVNDAIESLRATLAILEAADAGCWVDI